MNLIVLTFCICIFLSIETGNWFSYFKQFNSFVLKIWVQILSGNEIAWSFCIKYLWSSLILWHYFLHDSVQHDDWNHLNKFCSLIGFEIYCRSPFKSNFFIVICFLFAIFSTSPNWHTEGDGADEDDTLSSLQKYARLKKETENNEDYSR